MIACGYCKGQHAKANEVKVCAGLVHPSSTESFEAKRAAAVGTPAAATEKQRAFISKLAGERETPPANEAGSTFPHVERMEDALSGKQLSKDEASTVITWLLTLPKQEATGAAAIAEDLEDGMYRNGTQFVRVYTTKHGSNQKVAKRLVIDGKDADGKYRVHFEYEGKRGLKGLTAEMKLSADEAKQFGLLYGVCVRCGLDLTKDESIRVGYGKTCAGHEGWWYPTKKEFRVMLDTKGSDAVVAEAMAAGF